MATKTRIHGKYSSNLYPLGMINEVIHTGPGKGYIMVFYYLVLCQIVSVNAREGDYERSKN